MSLINSKYYGLAISVGCTEHRFIIFKIHIRTPEHIRPFGWDRLIIKNVISFVYILTKDVAEINTFHD